MIAAQAPAPQASQRAALILHFPHTLDTTGLEISYKAGGCGSFVTPEPGVWDYTIPSMCRPGSEIGPAESVRAAIFAPGYSIALIDVPSLSALTTPDINVRLDPLPLITVRGRVAPPDVPWNKPTFAAVSYEATWHCEFYRLADCMLGIGQVATSSPTDADGAFTVRIPDFAHDPALAPFSTRGDLHFNLKIGDPAGDAAYLLTPSRGSRQNASVGIGASLLPSPLVLYPYPRP